MAECFYEKGLCFDCNNCSECCRFPGGVVMLSEQDLALLVEWSGLSQENFISEYCIWETEASGKQYLCLKCIHTADGHDDCIFWDASIPGCKAYSARPAQCRTYPFWTKILATKESWDSEVSDCPGINAGTLHSKEEILSELAKYQARIPITR